MALHFVSTTILTSDDGIEFKKEVQLETEEAKRIRIDRERVAQRPLFMQLAEQQEKLQAEKDKITKLIFAPPKALDDEEFEKVNSSLEISTFLSRMYSSILKYTWYRFLQDIQENEQQYLADLKRKENEEIQHFKDVTKNKNMLQAPDNLSDSLHIPDAANQFSAGIDIATKSSSFTLPPTSSLTSSATNKRSAVINPVIKGQFTLYYYIPSHTYMHR